MKLLPKIIFLNTEEEQANYYFEREFSHFDYTDVDSEEWLNNAQVIEPDDNVLYSDFIDNSLKYNIDFDEELNEYYNQNGYEVNVDDEKFKDWLVDRYSDEFEEWKLQELHVFPMWNTIFFAKSNSIASGLQDKVNELYSLGLTLVDYKDKVGIMVNSAGHSFYDSYWIPLYKTINEWIKEVDDVEYNEHINRNIEFLKRQLK